MTWLVSEEVQRIHALITPVGLTMEQVGTTGIFPGHKKVAVDPYWDTNPLVKGMNNCVAGIKVAPMSPVWAEVNTMLSQANVDMIGRARSRCGTAWRRPTGRCRPCWTKTRSRTESCTPRPSSAR